MPSRNTGRALTVAAIVFVLDRISKVWVVEIMNLRALQQIAVAEPWLSFRMAWNEGVNFGLLDFGENGRWILIGLALAIAFGLILWVRRTTGWAHAIGVGAVIGGALGNVWDRVQYGAVADFLNVSCCGIRNPFAFNVADAAIFGGAFVLIFFAGDRAQSHRSRRRNRT